MKQTRIPSADGLNLAVYEAGNPTGPAILFIHGFNQASLCWYQQMEDRDLAARFRMVAYDIRGHGASDQPEDVARYANEADFAADTHAVITTLGLDRPVLVGWSYAGRLINDYVRHYGTGAIAGINYVGAKLDSDPAFNGPGNEHFRDMLRPDLAREIAAVEKFLRACFFLPPPEKTIAQARYYNMRMTPRTRRAHLTRSPDDGAVLATLDVPVLLTQGSRDTLVLPGLAQARAPLIPDAQLSMYHGIGHMPFAEDTPRFNRELAAFVTACKDS